METTIEIDCPPFTPRPDVYFREICKNILKCEYYEPQSKAFGNWEWKVSYKDKNQQNEVKSYLTKLYFDGRIRYASW